MLLRKKKDESGNGLKKRFSPLDKAGFTLIELLTVIMIIMALAGLVVGVAQQARKRATIAKAQAAIASLETALSMYEVDYGGYPGSGNTNMVTALKDDPSDSVWRGPYMMFKEKDLLGDKFVDSWGNAYHYQNPGSAEHGHDKYVDIWSDGPNGENDSGAGDDINNW